MTVSELRDIVHAVVKNEFGFTGEIEFHAVLIESSRVVDDRTAVSITLKETIDPLPRFNPTGPGPKP